MHEINIVRSMVKTVTEFARENKLDRVTEIVLDIGEVSLVRGALPVGGERDHA